jgi:hypothetical protein
MDVAQAEIELHIDEVVLEGGEPRSRHAVLEALHAGLTELFTQQPPALSDPVSIARIDAGAMKVPIQSSPQILGEGIATAVHGGLSR